MKTKTIKQEVAFKASPQHVYDALMSSRKHTEFTGSEAKITNRVGGRFTAYAGYIKGKNLELVPGERIVQEWVASDFPEGHVSKVIFSLKPTKTGTQLDFTHEGVPADQYKSLAGGWITYYWDPMKQYFEPK